MIIVAKTNTLQKIFIIERCNMNLSEKIIDERKKKGWSQEELADKLDVSRQSVSKWEGGLSTPEVEKIVKMAELFGVSTDYLLNYKVEKETENNLYEQKPLRVVSLNEATEFLSVRAEVLKKIALACAICVTSPIIPLIVIGSSYFKALDLPLGGAVAIAFLFLLIHVSFAVVIFIRQGFKLEKYHYLLKEKFVLGEGVEKMVKEKLAQMRNGGIAALCAGIVLCILGAMPIVIGALMEVSNFILVCLTAALLFVVSIAIYLLAGICGGCVSYRAFLHNKNK